MGSLSSQRINCQQVFFVVGINYARPVNTIISRGKGQRNIKSYITLFICFSIKIHLEVISQLSTNVFLTALRRFVNRHGCPRKIYSDNAINFVGGKSRSCTKQSESHFDSVDSEILRVKKYSTEFYSTACSPH